MNNDNKTIVRTCAIIGGIIGAILLALMIVIDGTSKGIIIGAGCLLVCVVVGIVIGSIIHNKKAQDNINEEEENKSELEGTAADNKKAKTEHVEATIEEKKTEEAKTEQKKEAAKAVEVEKAKESTEEAKVEEAKQEKEETAEVEEAKQEKEETAEVEEAEQEKEETVEVEEAEQEKEETAEVKEAKPSEEAIAGLDETEKEEPKEKSEGGFFARLVSGLTKTRNSLNESFNNLFSGFSSIDDDFYDELEETLVMADLGLDTTEKIIDNLKDMVKKNHIKEAAECKELVINVIKEQMLVEDEAYDFEDKKSVMLIIGVNGVGKTTSIGKLAAQYKNRGKKVMMCAADTFRAAAIDQLKTWADRAGVEIIAQNEGADPAAVTFDAVKAASARGVDILLVDTAGRLHNKKNLMDELAKMKRIIEKEYSDAHLETLIVLDGSTGQNALEQARQFSNVTQIDGIILTKLDGTAKGGIAVAIVSELNIPVKYVGVGEGIDDLERFNSDEFVDALFDVERDDAETDNDKDEENKEEQENSNG